MVLYFKQNTLTKLYKGTQYKKRLNETASAYIKAGMSIEEISKQAKCSRQNVVLYLKRNTLMELYKKVQYGKTLQELGITRENLLSLIASDLTPCQIEETLNCNSNFLRKCVRHFELNSEFLECIARSK